MKATILKTNNLTKKYSGNAGVKNIHMTLEKGDIYGFIGQNGAGKTTLLRLITSLIHPTNGTLELFGSGEEQDLINARKKIGAMIETPAFFPKMTARENLNYYRIQRGIADENEIERVLKLVNLDATGSKRFNQFSLGMKQRLGLALAIMGDPELLILDEPINGLDPTGMIEFREIISKLNQEKKITILISSHILSELTQIATRYGIIHRGALLKEFTKEELNKNTQGYISMKVSSAVKAGEIIQSTMSTKQFEVHSTEEIRLFDFHKDTSKVIDLLSSNGIKIYSSNEIKINLEDYFISVIDEIA
ncbi:ATP-binding cassette domain-containing protein [Candidatus Enterococcus murrayae]|uniref:ATP-binding cassette domain-containing protein n=1 Tax=Candidatus Enterococcus murrayae TaxID=2815321 RepID=A0ABS3HGT2_9ENTE|nr:ATP-binding cassette domain-containing protein [Enterococcus sp. MJM16]MBO0452646.1 ATP-binding cassette domain-containing protein [Enterococcus sp. MJM16]